MAKTKVLALFGESSAGKDSIQRWLTDNIPNMHKVISFTTRPPRDYEQEGKDYYFITEKELFKQILENPHQILEYTTFNDWYYGTSYSSLNPDKINVGVFNLTGIRRLLSFKDIIETLPVWIQANEKTRLLRSLKREQNPNCEEICRRFLADKKDFSNINFDYEIFLNDSDKDNYYRILNRPKINAFINSKTD